jgi:hypothetical protein
MDGSRGPVGGLDPGRLRYSLLKYQYGDRGQKETLNVRITIGNKRREYGKYSRKRHAIKEATQHANESMEKGGEGEDDVSCPHPHLTSSSSSAPTSSSLSLAITILVILLIGVVVAIWLSRAQLIMGTRLRIG